MSLYDRAEPIKIHQYRDTTERMGKMGGVTIPAKRCSRCDKHKSLMDSTRINGKFVCAGCK